jgi:transposase-like protein
MNQSRHHVTPEQKAEIVRRHVTGKVPISNLADEIGLQPTQIHNWVKLVLDQAVKAFHLGLDDRHASSRPRIGRSSSSKPSSFRSTRSSLNSWKIASS